MRRTILNLATALAALSGCGGDHGTGPDPNPPTRSFRLGFSAIPPRADQTVAVQSLEMWTRRADLAIMHESPPWTELIAGTAPETILARDKDGLVGYYRGKGLTLVYVSDATDGLDRSRDAPELRALGRSIAEPAIQDLYRQWVLAFVHRYHPDYVGLAAETNLIRAAAPQAIYDGVKAAVNAIAQALGQEPGHAPLFVSVQVEVAWGGLIGNGSFVGVEQDFADFPFLQLLGLSSYPYFVRAAPEDLPDDYYTRLVAGRSLPVMVVEGGWASSLAGAPGFSPEEEARYLRRQAALLSAANGLGLVQLTFTDLDLATFPPETAAGLEPFAHLGLVDTELRPKAALAVWDSLFALTRGR